MANPAAKVFYIAFTDCAVFPPYNGMMKTALFLVLGFGSFAQALEVHEWGTFTVLSGSNGAQVPWYASAADLARLPDFVSRSPLSKAGYSTVRMETPVIYFYPEKEMEVSIEVAFSGGNVTETFPHGSGGGAIHVPMAGTEPPKTRWKGTLHPPTDKVALAEIPAIPDSKDPEPYGAAREVPEAWIFESDLKEIPGLQVQPHFPQMEKFIFYRGAGNAYIPMSAAMEGDDVTVTNSGGEAIPFAVALRVRGAKAAWISLPQIPGRPVNGQPAMNQSRIDFPKAERPLDEVESELAAEWKRTLAADGLTPAEASAMVETWRKTWFRESGDRILTLVPRNVTDAMLPLKITPAPEKTTRVFVARIEMLSPDREEQLISLMNPTKAVDAKDFEKLSGLGLGRFRYGARGIASQIQVNRMNDKFFELVRFGENLETTAR